MDCKLYRNIFDDFVIEKASRGIDVNNDIAKEYIAEKALKIYKENQESFISKGNIIDLISPEPPKESKADIFRKMLKGAMEQAKARG